MSNCDCEVCGEPKECGVDGVPSCTANGAPETVWCSMCLLANLRTLRAKAEAAADANLKLAEEHARVVKERDELRDALYEALGELDRNPLDHDKCDRSAIDARWRLEQRIVAAIARAEGHR